MTEQHLSPDRFPTIALGGTSCSPEESAHLERCAECRLEWELVRTAGTLGDAQIEKLSPDHVAVAVLRRLAATEPASRRSLVSRPVRWVIGFAAAAAVAIAFIPAGPDSSAAVFAPVAVLHELDGLTSAELEAVLETIPPPAGAGVHVEASPLGELDARDLERVLRSME